MSGLLNEIADAAKTRFPEIPFPHRKDEYWRFADFSRWNVDALFPFFQNHAERVAPSGKIEAIEKSLNGKNTLTLFDGQLIFADVPQGVEVLSMGAAADLHAEKLGEFFSSANGKFDTLQASRPAGGVYIKIADGAKAELNLGVISKLGLSTVGIVIDIGSGADLKIARTYLAFGGSFCVARVGFFLGENAKLEISSTKFSEKNSLSYEREDFKVSSGAKIIDALAQVGVSPSRHEKNFEILGADAEIDSRAFVRLNGDITHDIRTNQMHRAGGAKSNVAIKAAISDKASLAFSGLIKVDEGAQKTNTYQSCRSLLLSNHAKAQASPILEICANDVSCSHGCTVAKPDADELFYMRQRGLNLDEALALMVRSFAESTFENLTDRDAVEKTMSEIF